MLEMYFHTEISNIGLQATSRLARKVLLMMDQTKLKKLQKGYVLEPVIPTFTDDASLPDKRERKKSSHFGEHSDDRPGDALVTLVGF